MCFQVLFQDLPSGFEQNCRMRRTRNSNKMTQNANDIDLLVLHP